MRQNLEELQATQEEVNRLRTEELARSEKAIDEIEKHRKSLLKMLDHVPDKVFLKDSEGKMLIVNQTVLRVHNMRSEDIIGKSDFDFIEDHDEAQKLWDIEQEIIRSGKELHEIQEETINNSGVVLDSRKIPFYIDYLDETGILGVQTDITKMVDLENKVKQLNEELQKLKKKQRYETGSFPVFLLSPDCFLLLLAILFQQIAFELNFGLVKFQGLFGP